MSTSSRHHIPFPKSFLSLNTPTQKTDSAATPAPEVDTAHTFLSNRHVARNPSVSSTSSEGSIPSAPTSPQTAIVESPILKAAVPAFLTLNSKHTAPPTTAKEAQADKTPFLSNKA